MLPIDWKTFWTLLLLAAVLGVAKIYFEKRGMLG